MSSPLDQFDIFPWNSNFETGLQSIDEQHQKLVMLLNTLTNSLINPETTEIKTAFEDLVSYAELHFSEEEKIWAEFLPDDPWLTSHQFRHAEFLPKIMDIKNTFNKTTIIDAVEHTVRFLIRWLAFHIIDNDKRMAFVVNEIKSGTAADKAKIIADKNMSGSMRILIETVLKMYDIISHKTIDLMKERKARLDAEHQLKVANSELKNVLDEIKTLKGIIPICSYCHCIRNDKGDWAKLEEYLSEHSDAMFSHGICPKCYDKLYSETVDKKE
jgi:hemerythrin-like metal-binding protein